ncbi:MAG: hypothetical protein R3B68_05515 [Phycisphaerales bacterium]
MRTVLCAGVIAGLVGVATAGPILINESAVGSVTLTLNPGPMGGSVFRAPAPLFSDSALGSVHADLAGDGINTNDIITILAADTDDGTGLFALLDEELGGSGTPDARANVVVVAHDAGGSGITGWVNDDGLELAQTANANPVASTFRFDTTFEWSSNGTGDAMALSRLDPGDSGTLVFNAVPGASLFGVSRGFQFVSFENGQWGVVGGGTFNGPVSHPTSTSLDWRVVPSPATGLVGLVALGATARRRRPGA